MSPYLRLASILAACSVAACAVGPNTSYVGPFTAPTDAAVIASGIGSFMRTQIPAPAITIVLDPTPADQASNALTPVLADNLRQQGFGVTNGPVPAGAHTLRYWVTPLDTSGELVRLLIDGNKEAARFFVRNAGGGLQEGGPFTVMQMEASR